MNNPSKIYPKSTRNPSQIEPWGSKIEVRRLPRKVWGPKWNSGGLWRLPRGLMELLEAIMRS